MDNLPVNFELN